VRLLVNSAAFFPSDTLEAVTPEELDRTLRVNLFGPVFVTQAFARALPGGMSGAVVNVTDWKTARPYRTPRFSYTLSKGAVDTFTLVAASELAPRIRVNAVALGVILPPPDKDDAYAERLAADLPLERVGGVGVVADAVLHLLSNDFITGETVRLDGGGHLR
jgi:NAD(P)-dependent dehydrogenase (short-subunit alcohol dehydrogenase family)